MGLVPYYGLGGRFGKPSSQFAPKGSQASLNHQPLRFLVSIRVFRLKSGGSEPSGVEFPILGALSRGLRAGEGKCDVRMLC